MAHITQRRSQSCFHKLGLGLAFVLGLGTVSSGNPALADKSQVVRDEAVEKAAGRTFVTAGGDVCVWNTGAVLEIVDNSTVYSADGVEVPSGGDVIIDTGGVQTMLLEFESLQTGAAYQLYSGMEVVDSLEHGDYMVLALDEFSDFSIDELLPSGGHAAPINPKLKIKSGDCSEPPPLDD